MVQKLLERVAPERLAFVQAFKGSVYELSTHPYGCRVLQRVFEHIPEEQTRPLLDELHKYTINLMQDQFGVNKVDSFGFSFLTLFVELCRTIRLGEGPRTRSPPHYYQDARPDAPDGEAQIRFERVRKGPRDGRLGESTPPH